MEETIYNLFFKGIPVSADMFIEKVKYFNLSKAKLKKFLALVNPAFLSDNSITVETFTGEKIVENEIEQEPEKSE